MVQLQMDNLEGTLVIISQGFTSVSFRLAKVFVGFCDEEKESWVHLESFKNFGLVDVQPRKCGAADRHACFQVDTVHDAINGHMQGSGQRERFCSQILLFLAFVHLHHGEISNCVSGGSALRIASISGTRSYATRHVLCSLYPETH